MGVGEWPAKYRADLGDARRAGLRPDIRLITLAFLAGVSSINALASLPPLWAFVPALLLCFWRGRVQPYLLTFLLAALWTSLLAAHLLDQRLAPGQDNARIWLQGHIDNLPETEAGRTRFEFVTATRPHRIRVSWYDQHPALRSGDCWRLNLKVNAPHGSLNPGGFDYETWLWRNRIGATGYVRDAERCDPDWASPVDRWRQSAAGKLAAALDDHPMSGVIRALSVGERSGISDEQWRIFRHTGTSHLVAISGLHIGLLAGLVLFGMRWLSPRLPGGTRISAITVAAFASALAAAAYALMAGFALPTQRALIMLVVVLGAVLLRRRSAASDLLAVAALAVLVMDPFAVLSPGFWLSFGAVAWILYLVSARVGARRWTLWLGLQPALVLALAPLTLFWFGEASLAAPLANSVLIPAFAVVVPLVLASVALTLLWPALGSPFLHLVADGLNLGWNGLQFLAQLPAAHFSLPQPGLVTVIIALAGVALLLAPRGIPGRWLGVVGLLPLLLAPPGPSANSFRLTVLDVGQGLAAVVRTAEHTLLFDAGPRFRTGFNAGEALVLPYLKSQGINDLDRLILSHADIDHRGGVDAVLAGIPVLSQMGAGMVQPCRAGERWRWDGIDFEILHPDGDAWTGNNSSCVVKVSGPGGSALLTGDIEVDAEHHLLKRGNLNADVLVVPHHGSATSSSAAFVRAVGAEYALIPADWNNRWNFPRPPVMARYRQQHTHTLQTGRSGAISVEFKAREGVQPPQSWREQQRRFWHLP